MRKSVLQRCKQRKTVLQIETNKLLAEHEMKKNSSAQNENMEDNEHLRRQIYKLQKQLDEMEQAKHVTEHPKTDQQIDDSKAEENNEDNSKCNQLYGINYKEEMVHLKYDIYCIKRIFESAIGTASRASHLARRLIDGVFKPDAILNCTFSGQAPKAQGEERRKRKYECLDSQARRAIIDYSIEYSEQHGWYKQTKYELNRSMSQKIGEIKRNKILK